MATSHAISTSCPRSGRPLVEDAVSLRVSDLRSRWGWLRRLDVVALDGSTVTLSLDVAEGSTFAWVRADRWPAGGRWSTSTYHVELVGHPAPLGGLRWRLRCPETGSLADALYLSPDGKRIACRTALGLAHRSQRQRAPARAAFRAQRIRAHLGGDRLERPKGQHASTFARHLALLATLEMLATS